MYCCLQNCEEWIPRVLITEVLILRTNTYVNLTEWFKCMGILKQHVLPDKCV